MRSVDQTVSQDVREPPVDFFTKLGFTFEPRFTDENATCMIVGGWSFYDPDVHHWEVFWMDAAAGPS